MLAGFKTMKHTIKESKQQLPSTPPTSTILEPLQDILPHDHEWSVEDHPPDSEPESPDTPTQADQHIERPTRRTTRIKNPTK